MTVADIEEKRALARTYLVRGMIYRWLSVIFMVMGFAVCLALFLTRFQGHFLFIVTDPVVGIFLAVPFLPSLVLGILANRNRRKFASLAPQLSEKQPSEDGAHPS